METLVVQHAGQLIRRWPSVRCWGGSLRCPHPQGPRLVGRVGLAAERKTFVVAGRDGEGLLVMADVRSIEGAGSCPGAERTAGQGRAHRDAAAALDPADG